jgi:hypothetical protein
MRGAVFCRPSRPDALCYLIQGLRAARLPLATFFRAFGARSVWDHVTAPSASVCVGPCDSAFGARLANICPTIAIILPEDRNNLIFGSIKGLHAGTNLYAPFELNLRALNIDPF